MHDFILQLLLLVVTTVVPIITTYVVKYYREKVSNEKFKKWKGLADIAVAAAQESFKDNPGMGAEKKRQVELWLASKLKGVSADDIDKLIQAAVSEINKGIK